MHDPLSHQSAQPRTAPAARPAAGRRRFVLVTTVSVLAWSLALSAAPSAEAAGVNVSCVGTQHAHFSPGLLLFTPRVTTLSVNEILAPCVSPDHPGITGLHQRSFQTRPITCLELLSPNSFTKVLTWSTGATSTFQFNQVASNLAGSSVVILTGVITDGLFAGSSAVETITGPAAGWECLFEPGLRDRINVVSLVITSL